MKFVQLDDVTKRELVDGNIDDDWTLVILNEYLDEDDREYLAREKLTIEGIMHCRYTALQEPELIRRQKIWNSRMGANYWKCQAIAGELSGAIEKFFGTNDINFS